MTTQINIQNLAKHYGQTRAVDDVSLTIDKGELFFILGPSGCGKTTLLRMIAGFIEPTAGAIRFGDRDVTRLAPNKRNTGMVFQSYALWPHMTVSQNVGFGLNVRKVAKREKEARIREALATVQMEHLAERRPGELSGGQQQRVALARAVVIRPDVLLLDEPLSNLDAKLRLELRHEIKRVCSESGLTTVYVTHDQKEALSMADRVAVMRDGKVEQIAPPRELYDRPVSRFVAEFLGETNFVDATVRGRDGGALVLESPLGKLHSTTPINESIADGAKVTCSIRPEALRVANGALERNVLRVKRLESIYLGGMAQHLLAGPSDVTLRIAELNPPPGERPPEMSVVVEPSDVVVLTH